MSDLYREIDTVHEFRGEGYFDATVNVTDTAWFYATPPRWKFAVYPDDRLILKSLGNDDYLIVGGLHDGDRYGIPLPEYQTEVEYRILGQYLKDIQPR